MKKRIFTLLALFMLITSITIIDQLSKQEIISLLAVGKDSEIVIFPFFKLILVFNHGVSFGFLNNAAQNQMLLIGVAIIIISILLHWYWKTHSTYMLFPIGLIVGGAIGNIIDRVTHGAVIDFLDFHYKNYHYPAFNIADSTIVIGALLLAFQGFREIKATPPLYDKENQKLD